jgi:glyoxylase-like metal-dependent hydrolase (beta-lactamase superfamily II)
VSARFDILVTGRADDRVVSTCVLLRDGDRVVVVDPGMVAERRLLLDPLAALGLSPTDVTDIVISHHHPDHTVNVALFPEVGVHDATTTYLRDQWIDRPEGAYDLSPAIRLLPTPGHTAEDQTTLVETDDGLVALTHLWWSAEGPADDPFAPDRDQLRRTREHVLGLDPVLIVPGHGAPFAPSASTPL